MKIKAFLILNCIAVMGLCAACAHASYGSDSIDTNVPELSGKQIRVTVKKEFQGESHGAYILNDPATAVHCEIAVSRPLEFVNHVLRRSDQVRVNDSFAVAAVISNNVEEFPHYMYSLVVELENSSNLVSGFFQRAKPTQIRCWNPAPDGSITLADLENTLSSVLEFSIR